MANVDYKVLVGLEIHVQLYTRTKMFCGCELVFGTEPNSRVCPVCLGMPGSLPVMNKQAVEFSILAGLALNCQIPSFTKWDRKGYYYPDLPKNYQISQYDLPLALNGYIEIPAKDGTFKKIRIRRAHLEEDAGKNLHTAGNFSQVDLNRAGTPLLEIVTEPDMEHRSRSAGAGGRIAADCQIPWRIGSGYAKRAYAFRAECESHNQSRRPAIQNANCRSEESQQLPGAGKQHRL